MASFVDISDTCRKNFVLDEKKKIVSILVKQKKTNNRRKKNKQQKKQTIGTSKVHASIGFFFY